MARCAALKPDGTPCERIVGAAQRYCYSHDEARAGERRANASKAAKSKGSTELGEVKRQLRDIADAVLEGTLDKGSASVAAQVLGVFIRAVEQERKVREQDELEERLAALEQTQTQNKGGYGWAR
jgi:flagellar motility protein MotE (MotC chaperone)